MRGWRGTYLHTEVRLPPGFDPPSAALVASPPPGEPPEDWIEVTTMGSREREWIPRHPLRHPPGLVRDGRAESGAPGEPYQPRAGQEEPLTPPPGRASAALPGPPGEPPGDWFEFTFEGSLVREWIPRQPLGWDAASAFADPSLIVSFQGSLTRERMSAFRAAWAGRHAASAERITTGREWLAPRFRVAHQLGRPYPADGPCVDCGMRDEPIDGDHRCPCCAELAALRPRGPVILPYEPDGQRQRASGRPAVLAVVSAVLLLMALFAGVALGLGMSGL